MTREEYFDHGWVASTLPHEQQPWVVSSMNSFHLKQNKWQQRLCIICHEAWPTRTCLSQDPAHFTCTRCKRDKGSTKLYSQGNDMHPQEVPPCLQGLSQIEEMLIARACPIMCVYRKHGGQRGYKGHVLNLPQDIQGFLDHLPPNVADLPILLLRRSGENNTHTDLRVRRDRVLSALEWLCINNPFYANITVDHNALQNLPNDGIPDDLLSAIEHEQQDSQAVADQDQVCNSHSFLPLPNRVPVESDAIRAAVNGTDPIQWPDIAPQPINEFTTTGLATQAFPALFPYGTGDPTCQGRQRPVNFTEAVKHLVRYADVTECGKLCWRFATHPRFPYWALNRKQRHQLISQTSIYLHHHPSDAHLTVEDLRDMVGRLSGDH